MGNGNIFDYAEVVIETCNGDVKKLQFDQDSFRESRALANRALGTLSTIGLGGKTMAEYQDDDPENWFSEFPSWSHLARVQVNKMNHQSEKVRPFAERQYTCEHTEVANAMDKFDESMAKGMRAFVLDDGAGGGHTTDTLEKEAVHTVVQPQYVGG